MAKKPILMTAVFCILTAYLRAAEPAGKSYSFTFDCLPDEVTASKRIEEDDNTLKFDNGGMAEFTLPLNTPYNLSFCVKVTDYPEAAQLPVPGGEYRRKRFSQYQHHVPG